MPIGKGELITATDINALIDDVKTESTRRADAWAGEPADKSRGDKLDSTPSDAMYDQLVVLNAIHCACEADAGTEAHNGGVPISLTANPAEPLGKNQDREINDDIVSLAAQCQCDVFVCTCVGNCDCDANCGCVADACGCDIHCNCNSDCQCSCYPLGCHPDFTCSCMCEAAHCYCDADTVCTCETQCSCNIDCACDNDCTCDAECDCEFGG